SARARSSAGPWGSSSSAFGTAAAAVEGGAAVEVAGGGAAGSQFAARGLRAAFFRLCESNSAADIESGEKTGTKAAEENTNGRERARERERERREPETRFSCGMPQAVRGLNVQQFA